MRALAEKCFGKTESDGIDALKEKRSTAIRLQRQLGLLQRDKNQKCQKTPGIETRSP
jgi:hypothetical protein